MKHFFSKTFALSVAVLFSVSAFAEFTDVSPSHPYFEAIKQLQEQGIVQGYQNGEFRPDNLITRSEFIKIILETAENFQIRNSISDLSEVFTDIPKGYTGWDTPYIKAAVSSGLMQGYPDGQFRRTKPVSYAEASKIIQQAFSLDMVGDRCYSENINQENPAWYFAPVCRMNSLITQQEGTFQAPEHEITRAEMALMITTAQSFENKIISLQPKHTTNTLSYGQPNQTHITPKYTTNPGVPENKSKKTLTIPNGKNMQISDLYSNAWTINLYALESEEIENKMLEDICLMVKSRILVNCANHGVFQDQKNQDVSVASIFAEIVWIREMGPLDAGGYLLNMLDGNLPQNRPTKEIHLFFTRADVEDFGMGYTSYQDYETNVGVVYMNNIAPNMNEVISDMIHEELQNIHPDAAAHAPMFYQEFITMHPEVIEKTPYAVETALQGLQSLSVITQLIVQTREEKAECITGFAHPSYKIEGQFCPNIEQALNNEHKTLPITSQLSFSDIEKQKIRAIWNGLGW